MKNTNAPIENEQAEYRADHIELDELEQITQETEFYKIVIKKLVGRGSKIIVGPRGVGKTHHMRIAHRQCILQKRKPLSIYVSFSKYLRLEPLKGKTPIAMQYFHCWVLSKILLALKETCEILKSPLPEIDNYNEHLSWESLLTFSEQIEKQQQSSWHTNLLETLSVRLVEDIINDTARQQERKHTVLLCDDAALVLTRDYMLEFFDIFRSLKSSKISPKASVYPNTEFGPRFHLGHDAEPVPCWPSVIESGYEDLFNGIYEKRFSKPLKEDVKKCLMYASFGVPRAFINMINQYNLKKTNSDQQTVNAVIQEQAQLIKDEFYSLSRKQPQFKEFISTGNTLIENIVKELATENVQSLKSNKKQIILGIKQTKKEQNQTDKNLSVIIRFFEEAGLLRKESPVKHGQDRVYDRYVPHFTLLLANGGFQNGRSGFVSNFSESISFPKEKHPLRKNSFYDFMDESTFSKLSLSLPHCGNCNKPRSSQEQLFCMYCGTELINKSTFELLMGSKIESLPITTWLKEKIKQETDINTIGDVIHSLDPGQELRKAKGVGKVKASKVIKEALDWSDEYIQ